MSLMGTLAKVAVGMVVVKGVKSLARGSRGSSGGDLVDLLGQLGSAASGRQVGDVSKEKMAFVNAVMDAPVDPKALAREVPDGAEAQTYMMSLIAID